MGMSQRLALLGLGITFSVGIALASVQILADFQSHKHEFAKSNQNIIDLIAPSATRAVHVLDNELAAEIVSGLLQNDFVTSAKIQDEAGNVLAQLHKDGLAEVKANWYQKFFGERFTEYSSDLTLNNSDQYIAGQVSYTVDKQSVYDSFYQRSLTYLITDLFQSFTLIGVLYFVFFYFFTRPVLRLAGEMETINFYQPGSRRFSRSSNRDDELGQLVDNGNRLLESVELALDSQRSVEVALRNSEEHLRQLIDRLPVFIAARNREGYIVFVNKAWASVFGLTPAQLRYVRFEEVVQHQLTNTGEILACDQEVLETKGDIFVVEERWHDKEGNPLFWQSQYTLLNFHDEEVVLAVSTDISDRKKSEADIAFMAYHDSLTNLPNRIQLVERLEKELHRAQRHGYFGAVLFIDLDQFKNINDSLGHPVGDVLLIEIARRLEESIRDEDLVARLGGDEFVLVLTVLDSDINTARIKAAEVGEKIRKCLCEPIFHDSMELRVTCSIGAVMFPADGVSVHELLRFADTAMYQVKEGGRNAIAFFSENMAYAVKNQLLLEGELHRAVEECQFELMYQPKVDVQTGLLTGAEALLRWHHPERGLVSPSLFIGALESSGLIVELGQWILEEACKKLELWQRLGLWHSGMRLSINISPRQFRRSEFVDDVKATLRNNPFVKNALDMEVTESVVIGNIDDTVAIMHELCEAGLSFSLDDFGTGYSSISYLKRLPVSTLKIDQSFVRDIRVDRNDKILVETMASMGRHLGLRVVAEGVEEKEQLQLIKDFGCDEYQGFYYGQAIPADDFEHILERSYALAAE